MRRRKKRARIYFAPKVSVSGRDGVFEYYASMRELEDAAGGEFFRCHRCYLVNMSYIKRYNANTIWMDNGDGIIIFITALKDYMSDAFDVKAFHFLVKPLDEHKFNAVISRAIRELREARERGGKCILIKNGGHICSVRPSAFIFSFDIV